MKHPIKLSLALAAATGLAACFDDPFDDEAKARLYEEKENLSLAALDLVAETCPDALQSSVLAHLSIADSRQTHDLQSLYDGPFAEEMTSFRYYQRVNTAAGPRHTIGSQEELETAITILEDLAARNVILTAPRVYEALHNDMRASVYTREDGVKELSIASANFDWLYGGLDADEWGEIHGLLVDGAFDEGGAYALYREPHVDDGDKVLNMQRMEDGADTVTTRFQRSLPLLTPQCL